MKRVMLLAALAVFGFVGLFTAVPAMAQGTIKETADFKITVPAGWEFSDFGNGAVQTYNKMGTFMIELKKAGENMTDKDVEAGVASLAQQYKGTTPEKVEMLGLTFYKTTFDRSSQHHTFYAAINKNGKKVSIDLMGPDHEKGANLQGAFKSIALK
jgi:hypothetical protein